MLPVLSGDLCATVPVRPTAIDGILAVGLHERYLHYVLAVIQTKTTKYWFCISEQFNINRKGTHTHTHTQNKQTNKQTKTTNVSV